MRFRAWFQRFGLLTAFIPALIPIPMPMKLFVITAGVFGTPILEFLGVVILARIIRYFGEVWLGVTLGHESTGYLQSSRLAIHRLCGPALRRVVRTAGLAQPRRKSTGLNAPPLL